MKFSVVWQPSAELALAKLWEKSRAQPSVTRASDRIEQVLKSFPERAGEELPDLQARVLFEGPLGVVFRVSMDDRLVQVLSVWDISQH